MDYAVQLDSLCPQRKILATTSYYDKLIYYSESIVGYIYEVGLVLNGITIYWASGYITLT